MGKRKGACVKWTLALIIMCVIQIVHSRPQETSNSTPISFDDRTTENPVRISSLKPEEPSSTTTVSNTPRDVKNHKSPVIGDSIQMVANQLLDNNNATGEAILDTRIPPKIKSHVVKHKIKTKHDDNDVKVETSHVGVAVPVTMEDLEKENRVVEAPLESSTTNEGISTWILLSNPTLKDGLPSSTEPTKVEEVPKKKTTNSKNKTKSPTKGKRPIIASVNKSDLVAGGSAISDNIFNKIKDTVLLNVQKNKNTGVQKVTTSSPSTTTRTTTTPMTELTTAKKESSTKSSVAILPVVKVTSKPTKKKIKNKYKLSTTEATISNESALLPMEAKEQEIELEISTPSTTTKKPKRSTPKKKKTKTKKRKTSTPKPVVETSVKTTNKTKSAKPSKKTPGSPITTQIYNYLSREVMPSVGVGVIGLAGLLGIAGYYLFPFASPVRRTFEVDKKDDIYRHNAEEYASEGNGQAEEEMLGTVLAGMPAHSRNKLNPYAAQTPAAGRYPMKHEQDIRYRHVTKPNTPTYNIHYPQQKTGIAHAAVYPNPSSFVAQQYETRHVYSNENKNTINKSSYSPAYTAVEPIYAAPQTGPSDISSYGNDAVNSVVYGVKPSADADFKPVYPFEGQVFSETTSNPNVNAPTSMYLGSNTESESTQENKYEEEISGDGTENNKFVVGNLPKELSEADTPAVVPEHGPRKLSRKKRSFAESIDDLLKGARNANTDIFLSNEIDDVLGFPPKIFKPFPNLIPLENMINITTDDDSEEGSVNDEQINDKEVMPMLTDENSEIIKEKTEEQAVPTVKTEIVESVSTFPINLEREHKTTTKDLASNELETTPKTFKVFEVYTKSTESPNINNKTKKSENFKLDFETTTDIVTTKPYETTAERETLNTESDSDKYNPTSTSVTKTEEVITSKPTNDPDVITYPPLNSESGLITLLKRFIDFKYRLGLSILQTTSDSLNRYLHSMEGPVKKVARASQRQ